MPIPKALLEAPELHPSSYIFQEAFLLLESERPNGEFPASIPYSKIVWMGKEVYEYSGDDLRYFCEVMRIVDDEVVKERLNARQAAYGKSSRNKTKPK